VADTGTGSGTVRLDVIDNDSIRDVMNYPLGGAGAGNGNFTIGEFYSVNPPPAVVSILRASANPTGAASVDFTVTFSEAVTGVDPTDFALTFTGITGPSVTSVTGTGTTYTVAVNTGSGSGTLRLDLMDDNTIIDASSIPLGGAGVENYITGEVYDIDRISPTVVSIVRASASPTGAASVDYTVTFSKAVTGVDTADFAPTMTGGVTGASVTGVTGSGTTYTVAVNTGSGSGTLRLDLMDDDTIIDAASNPLGGAGAQNFTTGEVYDIDKVVRRSSRSCVPLLIRQPPPVWTTP